jgi:DNA-binding protein H-NS
MLRRMLGATMKKRIDYQLMSTDELWSLHQAIGSMLATKLETERHKLQNRLDELVQKLTPFSIAKRQRRAYPKVFPKFQNPEQPSQTWAGRGKQPNWVGEQLAAGRTMDDLRIPAA